MRVEPSHISCALLFVIMAVASAAVLQKREVSVGENENLMRSMARLLIELVDSDHDDKLNVPELQNLMVATQGASPATAIYLTTNAIGTYDKNGDRALDIEEMLDAMGSNDRQFLQIPLQI